MKPGVRTLSAYLKKNNLTIAFAESMTSGLVANQMGKVKDASAIFKGSIVCYNEQVKKELLKVPEAVLKKYTAESQQVTALLAKNLSGLISADIHAAVTGLASSGGNETRSKPSGTVFFTVTFRKKLYANKKRYYGSPEDIRNKAVEYFFKFILKQLKATANYNILKATK